MWIFRLNSFGRLFFNLSANIRWDIYRLICHTDMVIVFFKRLDSRGFPIYLINIYFFSFHKHYKHCKTWALDSCVNFSRFLSHFSFDDFPEYKMSMGRTRSSILRLPWLVYSRRAIRSQKNSIRLCGLINSDWSEFKSRSFHESKPPPFETRFY